MDRQRKAEGGTAFVFMDRDLANVPCGPEAGPPISKWGVIKMKPAQPDGWNAALRDVRDIRGRKQEVIRILGEPCGFSHIDEMMQTVRTSAIR